MTSGSLSILMGLLVISAPIFAGASRRMTRGPEVAEAVNSKRDREQDDERRPEREEPGDDPEVGRSSEPGKRSLAGATTTPTAFILAPRAVADRARRRRLRRVGPADAVIDTSGALSSHVTQARLA